MYIVGTGPIPVTWGTPDEKEEDGLLIDGNGDYMTDGNGTRIKIGGGFPHGSDADAVTWLPETEISV